MPNPNMTYEELREQILSQFDLEDKGRETAADELIQLFATLCTDLVGPDVPIFVQGKEIKRGESMYIDFSEGLGSRLFEESCRNIQENGRNLEKADIRTRLTQLTTKNK